MRVPVRPDQTWATVRWQCDCRRWALWKAAPEDLERHGLDLFERSLGRITTHLGAPPASAFEALQNRTFTCLCGRRVPVVETLTWLLQFSAPILWEAPKPAPPARPLALGAVR